MKIFFRKASVFFITLFISIGIWAQNNCSGQLKLAKQLFESGQIEQIPGLLDSCLVKGFSNKEKIMAYQLLIQTYLFDYNQSKADEVMVRFLKEYPNYLLEETDPPEIKELFETFERKPTWSIEVLAGSNLSNIITNQYFTTSNFDELDSKNKIGIGYNFGVQGTKYFGNNFAALLGLKFNSSQYQNTEIMDNGTTQNEFKEVSNWISIPFNLLYFKHLKNSNLIPFVFCGAEIGILVKSAAEIKSVNNFLGNTSVTKQSDLNFIDERNKTNIWISSGIGIKYKLSFGSFKAWAGFNYSLIPFVKESTRFNNYTNILGYQHIDDDFKYNLFFLNISYSFDLYQIIKK